MNTATTTTTPVTANTLITKPLLERIIKAACLYWDITEDELINGKANDQKYCKHVCWYLIKENVNISDHRIGQRFNNEKHSTVLRAIDKIRTQKKIYAQTLHDIRKVMDIANTLV